MKNIFASTIVYNFNNELKDIRATVLDIVPIHTESRGMPTVSYLVRNETLGINGKFVHLISPTQITNSFKN